MILFNLFFRTITVVTGLTLFWLSRKSIVNRRHEDMVTRRRAKRAAIENNPDIIQQNINKN